MKIESKFLMRRTMIKESCYLQKRTGKREPSVVILIKTNSIKEEVVVKEGVVVMVKVKVASSNIMKTEENKCPKQEPKEEVANLTRDDDEPTLL
ncbi:hypothetical protein E3N88_24383 [Mikania micrantha]|uniref:Uncharacterized protein n=1 Tax=Mikania micrantha TaxID=192012 RepID=A0A5N6N1R5_9ASTR|nr:hypothetical protein E3N88_24383 [Mikania micrantha]